MDVYTIGRLALPGVIAILTVSTILMVATLALTFVRGLALVRRFVRPKDEAKRTSVTINIFPRRHSAKPPMQAKG
jgi:hypothetical protein